jgi:hypothetical protein
MAEWRGEAPVIRFCAVVLAEWDRRALTASMFPHRHAMCRADCPTALEWFGSTFSSLMRRWISVVLFFWEEERRRSHSGLDFCGAGSDMVDG